MAINTDEYVLTYPAPTAEELEDAASFVEDALSRGTGEIYDMLRRRSASLALTKEQRERIVAALHVIDSIEVKAL